MTITGFSPIDIQESEQRRICLEFLCRKFNWQPSFYIRDGFVYNTEEFYTSNSSWKEELKIRKVQQLDECLAEIFKQLKK